MAKNNVLLFYQVICKIDKSYKDYFSGILLLKSEYINMSKNPFINAFSASLYILLIVSVMSYVSGYLRDKPDTFFAPVVALSLLTQSVSVMAFLFFYQPLMLFINDKKEEAVSLFVKTVGIFAVFTLIALVVLFF